MKPWSWSGTAHSAVAHISHADKRSDRTGYKQSNKKYLHGNDGVVVFMAVEFRKALVDLSSPTADSMRT